MFTVRVDTRYHWVALTPALSITWYRVGSLTTLLGKCDHGSFHPTSLDCDGEDLLSDAGCLSIIIQLLTIEKALILFYASSCLHVWLYTTCMIDRPRGIFTCS